MLSQAYDEPRGRVPVGGRPDAPSSSARGRLDLTGPVLIYRADLDVKAPSGGF